MPRLIRTTTPRGEVLTLTGADYRVTVTLEVSGLELSAADVEHMLHAPLTVIAENFTPAENRSEA